MTRSTQPLRLPTPVAPGDGAQKLRKPRFLIAGEFSSGKTQLISGLLGETVLPSNVTSTALPPVWLIKGEGHRVAVDPEGQTRNVSGVSDFNLDDTRYGILSHTAPILDQVEIIDTPGNSDPNIPPEMWQQMVAYADTVIWCSNATQAWRQSEKSVWKDMPETLRRSSTILITHADRMADQRQADRVLRRVRREAGEFFEHFLLASLISDTDIARLVTHVQNVADGLTTRVGDYNPIIAKIEKDAEQPATKISVRPRRVRRVATAVPLDAAATETQAPTDTPRQDTPEVAKEHVTPSIIKPTRPKPRGADALAARLEAKVGGRARSEASDDEPVLRPRPQVSDEEPILRARPEALDAEPVLRSKPEVADAEPVLRPKPKAPDMDAGLTAALSNVLREDAEAYAAETTAETSAEPVQASMPQPEPETPAEPVVPAAPKVELGVLPGAASGAKPVGHASFGTSWAAATKTKTFGTFWPASTG